LFVSVTPPLPGGFPAAVFVLITFVQNVREYAPMYSDKFMNAIPFVGYVDWSMQIAALFVRDNEIYSPMTRESVTVEVA
jgi:hypothetical protein